MRWPWVSRLAYDLLVSERDSLRAQVAMLQADMIRVKRAEMGLRETPRVVKPEMQRPPEVPPEVRALYEGRCQSKVFEVEIERQAVEMFKAGNPWPEVRRVLALQVGEPENIIAEIMS